MKDTKIDRQARGTRIIEGADAANLLMAQRTLWSAAGSFGFDPIILPSLEPAEIYADKAGDEVLGQMYTFPDRKGRTLCLRPEGTATIQELARGPWKMLRDVKVWYFARCWRYERPQAGRYREFWQFGCEWVWPKDTEAATRELIELARLCVGAFTSEYEVNTSVARGLAYYTAPGFEIVCPRLGAQKQVCGGGPYAEGVGFAIGVERLLLAAP